MAEASEIRIQNAARAIKAKLKMLWMQVEQNSILMVADDRSGLERQLDPHWLLSHVAISI